MRSTRVESDCNPISITHRAFPLRFADLLFSLRIGYNTLKARDLARKIMGTIQDAAEQETIALATEKGAFPLWSESVFKDGPPRRNAFLTCLAPRVLFLCLRRLTMIQDWDDFYGGKLLWRN